ncbi:MAG TPA: signal recognition particle protein, partial [Syntrophomonas sp.]|nr:signal recognition particle protein [Syntrophomonas sp.]
YRPAAIKQLQVLGEQTGIPVYSKDKANPVDIAESSMEYARAHNRDIVILDTAGRLHINEEMMDELKTIQAYVKPDEIMLVVDAMTGQDA